MLIYLCKSKMIDIDCERFVKEDCLTFTIGLFDLWLAVLSTHTNDQISPMSLKCYDFDCQNAILFFRTKFKKRLWLICFCLLLLCYVSNIYSNIYVILITSFKKTYFLKCIQIHYSFDIYDDNIYIFFADFCLFCFSNN